MKFYFLFFYFSGLHRNWRWVAEIILISANHMYLVNKEYCFIIPLYYVVSNNQNSLERATKKLKNINIYNQIPTFFSFSENTVGQNKRLLFCVIFPFLSNALSLMYKRFLPVRHSSQTTYNF